MVADRLEGVASEDGRGSGGPTGSRGPTARPADEPIRLWARTNGYLVNDRGRIPAEIREAYEMSRR
ncbi:histone-like nucleoid-structuring protein Lsr2 [Streptomyces sp. NPDC001876]|uniref:Lsr2 family DNA-binding protein n=1 Tax=Streptomyces sp. NPDC001876 TaxID=3154402 RepID=UPI00332EC3C5